MPAARAQALSDAAVSSGRAQAASCDACELICIDLSHIHLTSCWFGRAGARAVWLQQAPPAMLARHPLVLGL